MKVTINTVHPNNLVVCANVVHVALQIDPPMLELNTDGIGYGWVAETGVRGHVTLRNSHHAAARFVLEPCDHDTAFTIRPTRGLVEPFHSLTCEVVYYPGLSVTKEQHFELLVHGVDAPRDMEPKKRRESQRPKEPEQLICTVRMPPCKLIFSVRRLTLGPIAFRLPCRKSVRLSNLGHGPAFYRIDTQENLKEFGSVGSHLPTPKSTNSVKIMISPSQGEVPTGDHVDLQITAIPMSMGKFEAVLRLTTHDERTTTLAVCGTVVPHDVTLHSTLSDFGGVCVTGQSELPFGLTNSGTIEALVEIDLHEHPEFEIVPLSQPDRRSSTHSVGRNRLSTRTSSGLFRWSEETDIRQNRSVLSTSEVTDRQHGDRIARILIAKKSEWYGSILFRPSEVAVHDFRLSILVNKTPLDTADLQSESTELERDRSPRSLKTTHRVLAIGLRQPLSVEPHGEEIVFDCSLDETGCTLDGTISRHLVLESKTSEPVFWALDVNGMHQFNKTRHGQLEVRDATGQSMMAADLDGLIRGELSTLGARTTLTLVCQTRRSGEAQIQMPILLLKQPLTRMKVETGETNLVAGGSTVEDEDNSTNKSKNNNKTSSEMESKFQSFKTIHLRVRTERPRLICQPARILLPPVPPGVEVRVPVCLASSHPIRTEFTVSVCWPVPETGQIDLGAVEASELECPFAAEFPNGQILHPVGDNQPSVLPVWLRFRSHVNGLLFAPHPRPACLVFSAVPARASAQSMDSVHQTSRMLCVAVPVSAAVDNSLISWFAYVARRPTEFELGYKVLGTCYIYIYIVSFFTQLR
ncbi:unnamed protein product [Echinostoma caproni]|uniref:Abnormal spindle-like microcephaly-associated protein ASH domain-containing protein n=1 Tax=Echinostoma caproni TaxID=27848 RepID=A0A3P8GIX1_9TREM|nr:unnamed protein product [Echinostoma caproni]